MRSHLLYFTLALAPFFTTTAPAATVFNNYLQSFDENTPLSGPTTRLATDFRTGGLTSTITSTEVLVDPIGGYYTLIASIYTDNGGVPGTLVDSFDPIVTDPNGPSFVTASSTSGITLAANTIYWEVLQILFRSDTSLTWLGTASENADTGSTFTTIQTTQTLISSNDGSTWQNDYSGNRIFSLNTSSAPVPEPSSMLLLLGGLAGLALRRRR